MTNIFENVKNMLKRSWSRAPDRTKAQMPVYFHTSARLDPVRVIARKAANVEAFLYDRATLRRDGTSAKPVDDHDIYRILERPCPTFREIDGWVLRYLTIAHYILTGEFFWVKVRAANGKIISLLPVPSAWVSARPTVGNHLYIIYPYGTTSSSALNVHPDDVIWFKDPDLLDPYGNGRGLSEAGSDELETDEFAAKYQKNFFYNDCTPPYVVLSKNGTPASADQIKKGLMEKLSGWRHAKEPAVLTGDVSIQKLADTPREVDMIESRRFLRDEAMHHYSIPPEIFGVLENSNRATIDAAFYLFNKNTLADYLFMYERVINAQLIAVDYASENIVYKHDHIISEDEELALKVFTAGASQGLITRNEFRQRFGLSDSAGPDVYVMSMGLVEVPADGTRTIPPTPPIQPEEDVITIDDEPSKCCGHINIEKIITDEEESRRSAIWKSFDAKASSVEGEFKSRVKKIADAQNADLQPLLSDAVKNGKSINDVLDGYFDKKTDDATKRTLAPAWISAMNKGEAQAMELLTGKAFGSSAEFKATDTTVLNALFNKWVEKYGLKKAKEINETTNKALRKVLAATLSDSVEDGDGLAVQVKKIIDACDATYYTMSTTRAVLIARTESASTVNYGSFATYKVNNIKRKQWIATRDDRTRDAHNDADGDVVEIDDKFTVGGEMMDFPGDPDASAENVCNCRCTTAPVTSRL